MSSGAVQKSSKIPNVVSNTDVTFPASLVDTDIPTRHAPDLPSTGPGAVFSLAPVLQSTNKGSQPINKIGYKYLTYVGVTGTASGDVGAFTHFI